MIFYNVSGDQNPRYFDGEYHPYPVGGFARIYEGTQPVGPLAIRIREGREPGDMLFSTPNVVSPRFLDLLHSIKATGFTPVPVSLVKDGVTVATFYALRIHGRGGPFDPLRSGASYCKTNPSVLFGHKAVYMDNSQWDGSDLFLIPGLGVSLFVTQRVAQSIETASLKNVILTRNTEDSW